MFSCPSLCKLNLFLYITGKRKDGYHNLQTLFVLLNYGDRMNFEITREDKVELLTDFGFPVSENLIYKAAVLLKEHCHIKEGVRISIDKSLPQGGGLGGGSGNAGTTLVVLNTLWRCGLTEKTLIELAAGLGADVPIFIKGTTCFGEGIGEILKPVSYKNCWYLVCTPQNCKVPTKLLFQHPLLKKDSPVRTYEELLETPFENCFEKVVRKEFKEVDCLLKRLNQFGKAYMSGSGSSCFVAFDSEKQALLAYEEIKAENIPCFIAPSVNKLPFIDDLANLAGE